MYHLVLKKFNNKYKTAVTFFKKNKLSTHQELIVSLAFVI